MHRCSGECQRHCVRRRRRRGPARHPAAGTPHRRYRGACRQPVAHTVYSQCTVRRVHAVLARSGGSSVREPRSRGDTSALLLGRSKPTEAIAGWKSSRRIVDTLLPRAAPASMAAHKSETLCAWLLRRALIVSRNSCGVGAVHAETSTLSTWHQYQSKERRPSVRSVHSEMQLVVVRQCTVPALCLSGCGSPPGTSRRRGP